jgi:hypothetical protein
MTAPPPAARARARTWTERLARVAITEDQLIEIVAQAIYGTHWKPPSPAWRMASDNVQEWVRAQARSAIAALCAL